MSAVQILPDRLERFFRPDFKLRSGTGKGVNSHVDVCIMQAIDWLAGSQEFSDAPDCVPATIRRYLIRLNDSWLFDDEHRAMLKPYAPKIIGLDSSREIEIKRGFIAADHAVRKLAPLWLRFLRREEWAAQLEAAPPVIDKASAEVVRDEANKVKKAAAAYAYAYADEYADAAAYAAAAAYAYADAAAYASAGAAAAAAAYAYADEYADAAADAYAYADEYADADAAADAAFCASLRSAVLTCLEEMIGAIP